MTVSVPYGAADDSRYFALVPTHARLQGCNVEPALQNLRLLEYRQSKRKVPHQLGPSYTATLRPIPSL